MSKQLAQIMNCFGQLYCKVEEMKCVGKNTEKEENLLEQLYIAYWISCGSDCDIQCFLDKYCSQCKPIGSAPSTSNAVPMYMDILQANYAAVADGETEVTISDLVGNTIVQVEKEIKPLVEGDDFSFNSTTGKITLTAENALAAGESIFVIYKVAVFA